MTANAKVTLKLIPAAKLDAEIETFSKTAIKLQERAHRIACSVLAKVITDGDVRTVMKFVHCMPEMVRVNGLRAWFEAHGPVKFVQDNDGNETIVHVKGDKANRKLGNGMAKPFYKFSANEGKPYEAIDLVKLVEQTVKRLEKDAKETGRDHTALIAAMRTGAAPATPVSN